MQYLRNERLLDSGDLEKVGKKKIVKSDIARGITEKMFKKTLFNMISQHALVISGSFYDGL